MAAAGLHSAQRTHAAVGFELLTVHENQIAGGLGGSRQKRAKHHGIGASNQGLADLTGVLHAAVGDERNTGGNSCLCGFVNRGYLGYAHTRDNTSGAN